MTGLGTFAWRLGLHPVPPSRGVLVVGAPSARLNRLADVLKAEFPRLNLYQVANEAALIDQRFIAAAAPFAVTRVIRWYLRRLKVQAIVVAGDPGVSLRLFDVARQSGIPLVCVGPPRGVLIDIARHVALCAVTAAERGAPGLSHVAPAAVAVDATDGEYLERLKPLLVSARAPGKLAANVEARVMAGAHRLLRRRFREIDSLSQLAGQLGTPSSILCLGNGPSSEDPSLADVRCDAVFRVNHSWMLRGHFERPDVIFTGKRDTLRAYREPTVFGLQTNEAAQRIMLRSLLVQRRFTYFTAERLGCMDFERFLPYKPTNGAVMIATAVALGPRTIVVAGVDLFSDPRGSYPGDAGTPNAYTVAHEREVEAGFILDTLASFKGEVVVVGDVLKSRWQRYLLETSANS